MNLILNDPACTATLADKKYFNINNRLFMKRTLRRHEWITNRHGRLLIPSPTLRQRWGNEAACLEYLRAHIDIPLPTCRGTFQDDEAFYFMTDFVEGVSMAELEQDQKIVVLQELELHIAKLHSLRSSRPGIPGSPYICAPYRVFRGKWKANSVWKFKDEITHERNQEQEEQEEYVFCHNDLGQHNILVDPNTLKIAAILDWEFAGFFPAWFEAAYWKREGPSCALGEEEVDDSERLREWLVGNCEEVKMSWPDERLT